MAGWIRNLIEVPNDWSTSNTRLMAIAPKGALCKIKIHRVVLHFGTEIIRRSLRWSCVERIVRDCSCCAPRVGDAEK